jgi:cytidylate kinase
MADSSIPTIAIDGPSASGKGTIAKKLADHYGFAHLDTGLLYRAVGMTVLRRGGDPSDPQAAEKAARSLSPENPLSGIDEADLRSDTAAAAASKVAVVPGVRAALLKFQKDFCIRPPQGKAGAVLDGRDIGTVIAPNAPVKIFVTASAEARALRRFKELQGRSENAVFEEVLADMKARDARDAERAVAPTKPAPDAVVLDTTNLDAQQAFAEALRITGEKLKA